MTLPPPGPRGYDVHVERGVLRCLGQVVVSASGVTPGPIALVSDARVLGLHGPAVRASLEAAALEPVPVVVPEGERAKTLAVVENVADRLVRAGLDRRRPLMALGGGSAGDLAGFLAATLFRGVPFVNVPTTLLAMADAAVGGKTAVNLPAGKNLLGAFHQPVVVAADPEVLSTLGRRDVAAGLAEVIKHALLGDAPLFAEMEAGRVALAGPDPATLEALVRRSVAYKASVVERDEREAGPRALLNFGHTIGHAVEAAALAAPPAGGPLRHGEAVAVGLLAAARVSRALGLAASDLEGRVAAVLAAAGLPSAVDPWIRPEIMARVAVDKKRAGATLHFIALRGPGAPEIVPLTLARLAALLSVKLPPSERW